MHTRQQKPAKYSITQVRKQNKNKNKKANQTVAFDTTVSQQSAQLPPIARASRQNEHSSREKQPPSRPSTHLLALLLALRPVLPLRPIPSHKPVGVFVSSVPCPLPPRFASLVGSGTLVLGLSARLFSLLFGRRLGCARGGRRVGVVAA